MQSLIAADMSTRKHICTVVALATFLTLLLGGLTSVFDPIAKLLPARSHLFFHLIAHAVLSLSLLTILSPNVPAEFVCAVSIAIAFAIDLLRALFVAGADAQIADLTAATVGSFLVFIVPRDGSTFVRPSLQALSSFLNPVDNDDDDDDSHRVNSWAV